MWKDISDMKIFRNSIPHKKAMQKLPFKSAARSQLFNLAKEDAATDLDLNQVVWKFVKGENSEMPAPRRSAFVMEQKKKEDD